LPPSTSYIIEETDSSNKNYITGGNMRKRIEYDSPIDSLVALAKRLSTYEDRYGTTSEDFFLNYNNGKLDDSEDFIEWVNDYENYMVVRRKIEGLLQHAA
jgi:hypothetical protein